ncbi:MAG: antitoxin Xre/MbcA/ParS toxin-binding domain-containing protein [Candidatus Melainabacteria bacterium]|jgi:hypothetical protein
MSTPLIENRAANNLSKQSEVALKTFFRIAELWNLSLSEQLTLLGLRETQKSTLYKWKQDGSKSLSQDTLERISYILGIYKSLQILFPSEESADAWIKKPNKASIFGGGSALERMLSGNISDLYVVRAYLDAQRGG